MCSELAPPPTKDVNNVPANLRGEGVGGGNLQANAAENLTPGAGTKGEKADGRGFF